MSEQNFKGDKKAPMRSPLADVEKKFITANIHRFPKWIEGYHLTLLTIPWTVGLIVFGYLSRTNIHWLWAASLMQVLQWFTDSFDGALGRTRDTGIPKWGFFMDHFLDFLFMPSAFIAWSFLFDGPNNTILWFMSFGMGALMVNSFLGFGATGEFKITYLGTGPTEMRIGFMIINTLFIFFGTAFAAKYLLWFAIGFGGLISIVVYQTQKRIWAVDMAEKNKK
jgi:phosphatidylglycerophosphate synthase